MKFSLFGIPLKKNLWGRVLQGWKLTTDRDNDMPFSSENLQGQLEDLLEERIEFVIVDPPAPVEECNFLQFCADNQNGGIHLEVSLKNKEGKSILLGKDALSEKQVLEMVESFAYDGKIPDVKGWENLGTFQ